MSGFDLRAAVERFDPELPIERAATPPALWYRSPELLDHERATVFSRNWIAVCRSDELARPGDQRSGDVAGMPVLVVRDGRGGLRAFHNACRHHATLLVDGCAFGDRITCPYHGWTYGLDGALRSAPRVAGLEGLERSALGLTPVAVEQRLGLVFVHLGPSPRPLGDDLAGLADVLDEPAAEGLVFGPSRRWELACDWKVFVDNYLDGGYHVSHLHGELAGRLDLERYRTTIHGRWSLQACDAGPRGGRLGAGARYVFVHPNLMLNRYGDVLDVNRVNPLGPGRCEVLFDWAFTAGVDATAQARCLQESARVQQEDVAVSEAVQRGLASPGYDAGVYAPRLEQGAHAFHRLLAGELRAGL